MYIMAMLMTFLTRLYLGYFSPLNQKNEFLTVEKTDENLSKFCTPQV